MFLNNNIGHKDYSIFYWFFICTIFFSKLSPQVATQNEIKELAESINQYFPGMEIANGVYGKKCVANGRKIIYEYQVPIDWYLYDDAKEHIINGLKESGEADTYYNFDVDIVYKYFKENNFVNEIFISSDELSTYEFKLGNYIELKDHHKSKGVNMNIQVPVGWEVKEGLRPNVVKKFVESMNSYIILIVDAPTFFSKRQARSSFEEEKFVNELISEQMSLLSSPNILSKNIITIDNYPALELKINGTYERMGKNISNTMKFWYLFYEDKIIVLQASIYDQSESRALEKIYFLITNSIILPDQYN